MAGDEEVEAVAPAARIYAAAAALKPWIGSSVEAAGVAVKMAIAALEAADRVRSRPAGRTTGGTDSEDHEAGIKAAEKELIAECGGTSPFALFDFKVAARNTVAAYLARVSSPVSGMEHEAPPPGKFVSIAANKAMAEER